MTTFVAVYRGETVGDARLLAVSADPALVRDITRRLLSDPSEGEPDGRSGGERRRLLIIERERDRAR